VRKQFDLPEADMEYLEGLGLQWEAILEGGQRWLLIHDYPIKPGYNLSAALVALAMDTSYPSTEINMAYFYPGLARADGKPIGALSPQQIDGKQFQRWSRHRTQMNGWRPGADDLCSHMVLIDEWLRREFDLR